MLIVIPDILNASEVQWARKILNQANWCDGSITAGSQARQVKQNQQLDDQSEHALALRQRVLTAIFQNPTFISAALPDQIYPPKFNRYAEQGTYGAHVDGSLMQLPGSGSTMRTDLSATLFFSDPAEYQGGELVIETQYGQQAVKPQAGHMVLYPSTSLHQVTPVTGGERLASFFWIQSKVKDSTQRELLYQLDQSIQQLTLTLGAENVEVVRLSGVYHNLIRQWAA